MVNNTNCVNPANPIPGVKYFKYTGTFTLNARSANWRFRYRGYMTNSYAVRSNSVTNIYIGAELALEASLNNATVDNSSSQSGTIIAPFYCINRNGSYSTNILDPDSDSMIHSLVAAEKYYVPVSYQPGYSPTMPLAASSFSFDSTTGKILFTPNLVQQSVVVIKTTEYRNGVVVGTTMREVTFLVLPNCNNDAPEGFISNNNRGSLDTSKTILDVCKFNDTLTFEINPTDINNDSIDVTYTGLPSGIALMLSNNNTKTPQLKFRWYIGNVPSGTYKFNVTLRDNGCPYYKEQTFNYTINLYPDPKILVNLQTSSTCTRKAVLSMTPVSQSSPLEIQYIQNNTVVKSYNNVTNTIVDSISNGNYILRAINSDGCFRDTSLQLTPPEIFSSVSVTNPVCYVDTTGVINVSASGGKPTLLYSINNKPYDTISLFEHLYRGSYHISIKDDNNCVKDTIVTLTTPDRLMIDSLGIKHLNCNGAKNGAVEIRGTGGERPYLYELNNGGFSSDTFYNNLDAGYGTLHIKDKNGCKVDSVVKILQPERITINPIVKEPLCSPLSNGQIQVFAKGGVAPLYYAIDTNQYNSTGIFSSLKQGEYNIYVIDRYACRVDTTIFIKDSIALAGVFDLNNIKCYGDTTGMIDIKINNGIEPFSYYLNKQLYTYSTISGLKANQYKTTVIDSFGCELDTLLSLESPEEILIEKLVTPNNCDKITNSGKISLNVKGGVEPYTYVWNNNTILNDRVLENVIGGVQDIKVIDANGCIKSDTVLMKYDKCCQVFVPTAFTPNGDGLNDIVRVRHKDEFSLELFSIYNRFGERVFTTESISQGWDGSINGIIQELGTYFYFVKGKCGSDDVIYKGSIVLMR